MNNGGASIESITGSASISNEIVSPFESISNSSLNAPVETVDFWNQMGFDATYSQKMDDSRTAHEDYFRRENMSMSYNRVHGLNSSNKTVDYLTTE